MRINLYKLHFLSFHFYSQLNKKVIRPPLFHSPTKQTRGKIKYFLSFHFFILLLIFHLPNLSLLNPNRPLAFNSDNLMVYKK